MDLTINWALIAPIIVIQLILMIIALIDCVRIEKTNGSKVMWIFIIILFSMIGPIAYFLFGRRAD
ncbi:PLDc_N domain-containing protein [Anaerobacillus sp. CMMVII]|uniref:PLD nuclease N-terminal domain-containing protein n=1 Tax=Anaerobacillus sp. CMMVII TaxID=2755588 RepID=UPI0021B74751|nr:PLD nuclease N-terminal domain-containing protein [Anaerobacillus sp. CMMVII]MCT8140464.1 PLDc_N domain-containing protein [Anaerobacillus sp. CMMVII]